MSIQPGSGCAKEHVGISNATFHFDDQFGVQMTLVAQPKSSNSQTFGVVPLLNQPDQRLDPDIIFLHVTWRGSSSVNLARSQAGRLNWAHSHLVRFNIKMRVRSKATAGGGGAGAYHRRYGTPSLSHTLSLTHTHTRTHTLSLCYKHTLSHTHTLTLSLTHTLTHSLSLSRTHAPCHQSCRGSYSQAQRTPWFRV